MTYKTRKRLALAILMLGLPIYIGLVVGIMGLVYDRWGQPPLLIELSIYIALGVLCVFPLKTIFKGVGQPDPDAPPAEQADPQGSPAGDR
jgi:predicted membrane channel-forming protein YqfA (hemolysin III family)